MRGEIVWGYVESYPPLHGYDIVYIGIKTDYGVRRLAHYNSLDDLRHDLVKINIPLHDFIGSRRSETEVLNIIMEMKL